jgi:hypothetical protein
MSKIYLSTKQRTVSITQASDSHQPCEVVTRRYPRKASIAHHTEIVLTIETWTRDADT